MYAEITYNYHGRTETCVAKIKYEIKNMKTLLTNQKAYEIYPLKESWDSIIYSRNIHIEEISKFNFDFYERQYWHCMGEKIAWYERQGYYKETIPKEIWKLNFINKFKNIN